MRIFYQLQRLSLHSQTRSGNKSSFYSVRFSLTWTFTTWLLQYAYHRSFDRRAHLQANHFYDLSDFDDQAPTALFYGAGHLLCLPRQEVVCLVEQALAILGPHQRKVIELTYFEGLTAQEIADKTGDSASSVRHHLYRGMKKVRRPTSNFRH